MALTDWSLFTNGSGTITLTGEENPPSTVIINGQSLVHRSTSPSVSSSNAVPTDASGLTHGLTSAKLRTLIRNETPSGTPISQFGGIVCMQSADNMTHGTGTTGYLGGIYQDETELNRFKIARLTDGAGLCYSGGALDTAELLALSGSGVWTDDTVVAIELEWHVRQTQDVNGIHLILRAGPNFGSMTNQLEVVERGTDAILSTVGEGVLFANAGDTDWIVAVDDTELISMPIIT